MTNPTPKPTNPSSEGQNEPINDVVQREGERINKLCSELMAKIEACKEVGEPTDTYSWSGKIGVLISVDSAKLITELIYAAWDQQDKILYPELTPNPQNEG